ncbi:MAG: hypothetical protein QOG76_2807 [Pseudonocardiales bacterium]|nr:hypothetical protein [Pseudonocardiales bacterium]
MTRELGDGTVSVIDSSTFRVIATIPVGLSPQFVAVDPDRTTVGVTNFGDGTVSVIDTGTLTVTKTISAGGRPSAIAAYNRRIYVTNADAGTVTVIDPTISAVIATIPVGPKPFGVAVGSGSQIYVANQGNNTVSVVQGP